MLLSEGADLSDYAYTVYSEPVFYVELLHGSASILSRELHVIA